jgi:hypothetical protein
MNKMNETKKRKRVRNNVKKNQTKSYNFNSYYEEKTNIDELYMLDSVISNKLEKYIGGGSYEDNGRNFNFTFNGKPFLMRVSIDDYHYDLWKKNKRGYWSDDFDRNQLNIDYEVKSKTVRNSRKLVDLIFYNRFTNKLNNRFTNKLINFLKEKVLYNILPIYYKYQLNK